MSAVLADLGMSLDGVHRGPDAGPDNNAASAPKELRRQRLLPPMPEEVVDQAVTAAG